MGYRYLGNKAWLAPKIVEEAERLLPLGGRVADPMCGTASVAAGFALAGFSVVAADQLTFPVIHAKARLLFGEPPAFRELGMTYAAVLDHLNRLEPVAGLFAREYGAGGRPVNGRAPRRYFTDDNARHIDAVRAAIGSWWAEGTITAAERSLLLHDLILAVNDVANIAGTYGYFRSRWSPRARLRLRLAPSTFHPTRGSHEVRQGRVEEVADTLDVDLVYLDPPYTKRQYAGNYHILETLAIGDDPDPVGDGGLRDWYPQSSDFCSKRRVRDAFHEVLKRLDVPHVLISYSEDGQLDVDDLEGLLYEHGDFTRRDFVTKRFRSNGGSTHPVVEYLYHVARR